MPIINRFNQPVQTATFQPMNLQELSLAPSMLAQKEEKTLDQADALSAIDVNRLQGDEELVSGKLGDLRTKISKLSERLASEGYNKDIANQLRKVKTEYSTELGPTGTLGRAQSNYQMAYDQWKNVEQDLRRQGASQRDIEINKQQFFSGYKGMKDGLGNLQDFTSGKTAGYFDVRKEAMDLFRQAQDRGKLVGVSPNNMGISVVQVPGGGQVLRIVDKKTGQIVSNTESLGNAITSLFNEYTNPDTQRGFYARSTGMSPEYLGKTFRELADVYKSSKYTQIPYEDVNYQNAPKPSEAVDNSEFGTYYNVTGSPNVQKAINSKVDLLKEGIKNGKFSLDNIKEDSSIKSKVIREGKDALYSVEEFLGEGADFMLDLSKDVFGNKTDGKKESYTISNKVRELKNKSLTPKRNNAEKFWEDINDKYPNVISQVRNSGGNDEDIINAVAEIETNKSVNIDRKIGLNAPEGLKNIVSKVRETTDNPMFISTENKKDTYTSSELKNIIQDMKISSEDFYNRNVFVDSEGNLTVQLPKKGNIDEMEEFKLNPATLPQEMKVNPQTLKQLEKDLYSYNLSKQELESLNNKEYTIGGNTFRIYTDPNNILKRGLITQNNNGEYIKVPLSYIHRLIALKSLHNINIKNKD